MTRRAIIEIDEAKCDGCGQCVAACAEGAIQIVDGKARLVSETYCDGLGACLGTCPRDAIRITEREAADYDEAATHAHVATAHSAPQRAAAHSGCPGLAVLNFGPPAASPRPRVTPQHPTAASNGEPPLSHWPVQLHLVPPTAPFLRGAELCLVADCVPFACADFHQKILQRRPIVIGCPKLDDGRAYVEKLTEIFRHNPPQKITVVHMEVPCCTQLLRIAAEALRLSGAAIPLTDITVTRQGEILQAPR